VCGPVYDSDGSMIIVAVSEDGTVMTAKEFEATLASEPPAAVAMIYPEPEKGGRGKKSAAGKPLETSGFSRWRACIVAQREMLRPSSAPHALKKAAIADRDALLPAAVATRA
jgi:hypothetical protein